MELILMFWPARKAGRLFWLRFMNASWIGAFQEGWHELFWLRLLNGSWGFLFIMLGDYINYLYLHYFQVPFMLYPFHLTACGPLVHHQVKQYFR